MENWNLAASRRRQCRPQGGQPMRYGRWVVILHPLGPSTISCYEKTEFGAFLPPSLREVAKIFDF